MRGRRTWTAVIAVLVFLVVVAAVWLRSRRPIPLDRPSERGVPTARTEARSNRPSELEPEKASAAGSEEIDDAGLEAVFSDLPDIDRVRVFGTVTDARGEPPERADVHLFPVEGSTIHLAAYRTRRGEFATERAFAGEWTLQCRADGFREHTEEFFIPEGAKEHRIDIVLEPTAPRLDVYLFTPGGRPLAVVCSEIGQSWGGIAVTATDDPPPRILHWSDEYGASSRFGLGDYVAASSRDDEKRLEEGFVGRLETDEPPPFYASAVLRNVVLDTRRVEPGSSRIDLFVSPEDIRGVEVSLRFRVVDASTGEPLPRARVASRFRRRATRPGSPVDENAVYERDSLYPGLWSFAVRSDGYETSTRSFRLHPGEARDLGDWPLRPASSISGRFVDPAGQPGWIEFRLFDLEGPESEVPAPPLTGQSLPDGEFRIEEAGRSRYALVPAGDVWAFDPTEVDTRSGPVEDLTVALRRGTPVTFLPGRSARSARWVHVLTPRGLTILSRGLFPGGDPLEVPLAPGAYRLVTIDNDGKASETDLEVGDAPMSIPIGDE